MVPTTPLEEIDKSEYYFINNSNRTDGDGSFTVYNGSDQSIGWNPEYKLKMIRVRKAIKGLIHEIVHAFDKDINRPQGLDSRDVEGRAISVENTVDDENSEDRFYHGGQIYSPEEIQNYLEQVDADLNVYD